MSSLEENPCRLFLAESADHSSEIQPLQTLQYCLLHENLSCFKLKIFDDQSRPDMSFLSPQFSDFRDDKKLESKTPRLSQIYLKAYYVSPGSTSPRLVLTSPAQDWLLLTEICSPASEITALVRLRSSSTVLSLLLSNLHQQS